MFNLYLFDADDTLFDFKLSEARAFEKTLELLSIEYSEEVFFTYKSESARLWRMLELGQISKQELRVERFKNTFESHKIDCNPESASQLYLEKLTEVVHLRPYAREILEILKARARIGIITNGIQEVQIERLRRSRLSEFVDFMVVSDECGFAKPDRRFFEYTMKKANRSDKQGILVIGDRIETDIIGAQEFGLDSCWYNPKQLVRKDNVSKFEISCLSQLSSISKLSH